MVSYLVVVNADDEPLSGVASDAEQQLLVVPVPPPSHCVRAPVIATNEIKAKKKNYSLGIVWRVRGTSTPVR